MTQAAAKTGSDPTVLVAIEQHFPNDQRIIDDVLAYRILPLGMRAYVWLMRLSAARNWMIRLADKRFPVSGLGDDPSEFEEEVLEVRGVKMEDYRVLRAEGTVVPNAITAFLLYLRDTTGRTPNCYFG
jgi:hypothetical protein